MDEFALLIVIFYLLERLKCSKDNSVDTCRSIIYLSSTCKHLFDRRDDVFWKSIYLKLFQKHNLPNTKVDFRHECIRSTLIKLERVSLGSPRPGSVKVFSIYGVRQLVKQYPPTFKTERYLLLPGSNILEFLQSIVPELRHSKLEDVIQMEPSYRFMLADLTCFDDDPLESWKNLKFIKGKHVIALYDMDPTYHHFRFTVYCRL
jgi:hypothetical protein